MRGDPGDPFGHLLLPPAVIGADHRHGQAAALIREMPAGDLVDTLARDTQALMARLSHG